MSRPTDASFGWQRSTKLSCSPTPTPWPRGSRVPPGTCRRRPRPRARALRARLRRRVVRPLARGGGRRPAARPRRGGARALRLRRARGRELAVVAALLHARLRADLLLPLDRAPARARERVVHVARAVVARDHALLLQLVLVEVRVEGLDERVEARVGAQRAARRHVDSARRALVLADAQALLDALGAEAVQALHHDHRLAQDAEAHRARELRVDRAHGARDLVALARAARRAVDIVQRQPLDFDRLLPPRDRVDRRRPRARRARAHGGRVPSLAPAALAPAPAVAPSSASAAEPESAAPSALAAPPWSGSPSSARCAGGLVFRVSGRGARSRPYSRSAGDPKPRLESPARILSLHRPAHPVRSGPLGRIHRPTSSSGRGGSKRAWSRADHTAPAV